MSDAFATRPSSIYSRSFLLGELLKAATTMRRDEFAQFQTRMINQMVRDFRFDALSVNVFRINHRLLLDGEVTNAVANTPRSSIDNYLKHQEHDDFSHATFLSPGAALFNDALRSMDEWLDHPIYRRHCIPYDHYWVLSVAYRLPHHTQTFIAFDHMRGKGAPFPVGLTERQVEYIAYPFYLGWLCVLERIDAAHLREWLTLLAGMSEPRFRLLRGLGEPGLGGAAPLAERLGISCKAVYGHFENACENLYGRRPELAPPEDKYGNRELTLLRAYSFLSLGAGPLARNLPLRRQFR